MRFEIDEANTLFLCFIINAKLMKLLKLDIINQSLTVIKYNVGLSFFFFWKNDIRHTSDENQNLFGFINFKDRLSCFWQCKVNNNLRTLCSLLPIIFKSALSNSPFALRAICRCVRFLTALPLSSWFFAVPLLLTY